MRITEADRNWCTDSKDLKHQHIIDKGFYKMMGRFHVHFNPKLIWKIIRERKAQIIIGGAWNDLDVLLIVILKKLCLLKNELHFWSEANHMTVGASHDNLIKQWIRKFVYHSSNGAQLISGKMTEITLEKWGIKCNGLVKLPNTIEEDKFIISDEELNLRDNNSIPVFLMPVRLLERDKGILNFFKCIGPDNIRKANFLIAGDGPDKDLIHAFISSNNLDDHIKLLGYCETEKMITLYKTCNLFLLPSFSDPSPLSLIEAIRMKLPVLVSERCGNHFEAVKEFENGYIFDPYNEKTIISAYQSLLQQTENWKLMGKKSGEFYDERFNKSMVISRFVDELLKFSGNLH
uniref:glycosyltransferase family 4 protein n=1 Tax=Algoriphagus sp. TaxID=1872435 RepID=UPI0040488530